MVLPYLNALIKIHFIAYFGAYPFMKHILMIFLLQLGFSCHAEWVRGTILLNDGQTTDYFKNFNNEETTPLEFKIKEKDEPTEIQSNDIAPLPLIRK